MRYNIEHLPLTIPIGIQTENAAEAVEIDAAEWFERYGSLTISVWVTRPGESEAYPAAYVSVADGIITWLPSSADTAIAGNGKVEILALNGEKRLLSGWTEITIKETSLETTKDTPDGETPWIDTVVQAASESLASAAAAAASATQAAASAAQAAADADEFNSSNAPAIIPTASGSIVTISDSADRPFAGLRLYGKTTQDGTPTPDAPVELVNAGASGSIWVHVGKNLLDVPDVTLTEAGYAFRDLALSAPEGYYTLSFVADAVVSCQLVYNDEKLSLLRATAGQQMVQNFYATGGIDTIRLYVSDAATIGKIQLEAGATFTGFEAYYGGGSVTATKEGGMAGIMVASGGNYTDEDGVMWLSDVRDYSNGVDVQKMCRIVFDGSQTWTAMATSDGGTGRFLHTPANAGKTVVSTQKGNIVCSALATVDADNTYLMTAEGIAINTAGAIVVYCAAYAGDVDAWQAYLASNPMTVVYELATPIETALTADEIAAYRAMTSHKPNTTVYNDGGAGMQVDYIADTKTYIDQRISALLNA